MSVPRKHHYLPQFYLDGFKIEPQEGKKPHTWQIEKHDEQRHYSSAIEDTCCIRDYHSLDIKDKDPDHSAVETVLSRLEGEQSILVRAIREAKWVAVSQIESLAACISLMRYRVPVFAKHVEKSLRSVVLDTFKMMYHRGAFPAPPPELQRLFEDEGIDDSLSISISNWKILSQMFAVGLAPESVGLLAQYTYHVYTAANGNFFITSDNPVALHHPNYDEIRPYGVGLAMKGVEVTIPLSSDTLIRAGYHVEPGASIASSEEVEEFNRRAIIMSERYVFSSVMTTELRRRINELRDIRAGFVFDNLFYGDGWVHVSRFIPVQ